MSEQPDTEKEKIEFRGREEEAEKKPSLLSNIFSKKWSNADQTTSDKSPLAKIINQGVYMFMYPACKNKKLTQKDIDEVNLGGAIVGLLVYLIPNFSPNNPLVLLPVRLIMLLLKVKHICAVVSDKVTTLKDKIK